MNSSTDEMANSIEVQLPWIIEEETELWIELHNRRPLGSEKHLNENI